MKWNCISVRETKSHKRKSFVTAHGGSIPASGHWSFQVCLLICLLPSATSYMGGGHREIGDDNMERSIAEIFSQGLPRGLVLFHLDPLGMTQPRLAILNAQGLRIFSSRGSKLVTEFNLKAPPLGWDELESFPSLGHLPGVILWGGSEYPRGEMTIICYVKEGFKLVFTGIDASIVDLNHDGIPEVLVPKSSHDSKSTLFEIWVWSGTEYVLFNILPLDRIFTKEVLTVPSAVAIAPEFED